MNANRISRILTSCLSAGVLLCILSCCSRTKMDESAFIFNTSNIDGQETDYARPAIITGHITNRDVYPDKTDIQLKIPFFDRVAETQSSVIYDDSFSFTLTPYALRTVSIPPFIDFLVIAPGDSIHVEIDFRDLSTVTFSGRGAENNEKYNRFHMGYYLEYVWPGYSNYEQDSDGNLIRAYPHVDSFVKAVRHQRAYHRGRLEAFLKEEQPSPELEALCRREIETDYFNALLSNLTLYHGQQREDISPYFQLEEVEPLFDDECINDNLFDLTKSVRNWLYRGVVDEKEAHRLLEKLPARLNFLKKASKNEQLSQMLVASVYSDFLESNEVERFEEHFDYFDKNVRNPLLKLSVRDKYAFRKNYQENPRLLSDAILKADEPADGQQIGIQKNEGLQFLRSVIAREERKVLYICIGATWCIGTTMMAPHQAELAADYQGQPLRIANFLLDMGGDINALTPGIENYHITAEQRFGLAPILHLGIIPYFILIDKDGVIVDFGPHLLPDLPETREKIDRCLASE